MGRAVYGWRVCRLFWLQLCGAEILPIRSRWLMIIIATPIGHAAKQNVITITHQGIWNTPSLCGIPGWRLARGRRAGHTAAAAAHGPGLRYRGSGYTGLAFLFLTYLGQHRTIPALRLKHRSGSCGTASALPKCSIIHKVLSALLAWHLPHLARRIGT